MALERIQDRCVGRWEMLLPLCGIGSEFLTGKHRSCPVCGGKDRFRFDNKGGNGTWFCTHCGAGNGVDLIMKMRGLSFIEATQEIKRHIGETHMAPMRASKTDAENEERRRDQMAALWGKSRPLDGSDTASRYMAARCVQLAVWPAFLRFIDELPYYNEAKERSLFPAMLAKFAAADGKSSILHRTYLDPLGVKADIPKPKMLMPGKVPMGGAVRLFPAGETIGIAEGIETALSAAILFNVPVWSALATGPMLKWIPPKTARCVMIFGDNDANYAGQNAAYSLAYRLKTEGVHVDVRIPDLSGDDWNDVLISQGMPSSPFRLPSHSEGQP